MMLESKKAVFLRKIIALVTIRRTHSLSPADFAFVHRGGATPAKMRGVTCGAQTIRVPFRLLVYLGIQLKEGKILSLIELGRLAWAARITSPYQLGRFARELGLKQPAELGEFARDLDILEDRKGLRRYLQGAKVNFDSQALGALAAAYKQSLGAPWIVGQLAQKWKIRLPEDLIQFAQGAEITSPQYLGGFASYAFRSLTAAKLAAFAREARFLLPGVRLTPLSRPFLPKVKT